MTIPFTPADQEIVQQLKAICGGAHVSAAEADRAHYAVDQSGHAPHMADVVVWPQSAAQVASVLRLANERRIAVTPWGAGTSLEGNPIPVHGGILLNMGRMQQIVAVHVDDFQVTVQPGLGYKDLNEHLAQYGLFYPPDPGANATIGGMLANNAAGIRTVRYGATKDNVLRAQVALADGRLLTVGSRSVKQSSGYDLLHLFIGSEGTLGVLTEATLKLAPIPTHMSAVVATFPNVTAAVETVVAVRGSGLDPAALEFIDAYYARILSQEEGVELGEQPVVFMEFHAAHEATLEAGVKLVREICEATGALDVRTTTDPTERRRLWHARHHAYEISQRNHPGKRMVILDVAVPISAYPELVAHVEETLVAHETEGYMIGHAGDGNLHAILPFDDDASYQQAQAVNEAVVLKALELDGTATGEHGVGIGKARYMAREHGETVVEMMRAIKETVDPQGIMNPGKIFA